jgi:fimbrial chaperone protein
VTARIIITAAVLAALGLGAASASADGFQIAPTRLSLDEATRGGVLQLANARDREVRFRVAVHAWRQTDDGEMVLGETDDVRVYPRHLELAAGGRAIIRVLAKPRFGAVEGAYRIVVEEVARPAASSAKLRMRIAIPVFLASTEPRRAARIDDLRVSQEGEVSFALANTGSVHLRPRSVEVVGLDAAGREIARARDDGWYVLPGGRLRHELSLGREVCSVEVRALDGAGEPLARATRAAECPLGVARF